jgi:hypothetical protein
VSPLVGTNLPIIINANAFYFTWAAFVTTVLIAISCVLTRDTVLKEKLTQFLEDTCDRIAIWAFFTLSSVVVMGVTSAQLKQNRGLFPDEETKTKFIISVGTVGTGIGIIMLATLGKYYKKAKKDEDKLTVFMRVEGVVTLALIVLFAVGVAYATGPGGEYSFVSLQLLSVKYVSVATCFLTATLPPPSLTRCSHYLLSLSLVALFRAWVC